MHNILFFHYSSLPFIRFVMMAKQRVSFLFLVMTFVLTSLLTPRAFGDTVVIPSLDEGMDLKPYSRMWIDTDGTATARDVDLLPDSAFQALGDRRAAPVGPNQAIWLRFDLMAQDNSIHVNMQRSYWLSAQQVSIDSISAFVRLPDGAFEVQHAGTALPVAHWRYPNTRPAFALNLNTQTPTRVLVRAQDPQGSWTGLTLWPSERWVVQMQTERMISGMYLGVILVVALLAIFNAVIWRETLWLGYAAYHLLMAGGQLALLGMLGVTVLSDSPWWNEYSIFTLVCWSAVAFLVFCAQASQSRRFAPNWRIAALILAGCIALACTAFAWFRHGAYPYFAHDALHVSQWWLRPDAMADVLVYLTFSAGVVGTLLFLMTGWRGYRLSLWMLIPMFIVLLSSVPQALYSTGFAPRSILSEYGFVVGLLLEAIAMMLVLMKQSRLQASTQTRIEALGLHDALTGLANRQSAPREINNVLRMCNKRQLKLRILVSQIENWADLTKQHGHEVSEHAILVAAHYMASVRRAGDVVVRLGHAKFLFIGTLDETKENTPELATSIVAHGLSTDRYLTQLMKRDIRVWTAEIEPHGISAEGIFEYADQAANRPFQPQKPRRIFSLWEDERSKLEYQAAKKAA